LTYVFVKSEEKFEKGPSQQENENAETFSIKKAWVNLHLRGATIKKENIIKEQESSEHFNYFYPSCPEGINDVRGYQKLTFKNIYPAIDWVLYSSNKAGIKYDFVLHPGA